MMCKNQGLDFFRIRNLMKDNYSRNKNLPMAGFTAGPCLMKDTMQLSSFYNHKFSLCHSAMSINEDYFFPQTAEGRGSKVDTLPGGTNLGEIDDLRFFTNKLFRGLRIPSSYLPTGAEDGGQQYNDGRVGTAYIQELRFNKYCERLQNLLVEVFNQEFKRYLLEKGVNIGRNVIIGSNCIIEENSLVGGLCWRKIN